MLDYHFLNLSPVEFENLIRDLLQKKFRTSFESFKGGRDNGIDLRYTISKNKDIIVQCKRYDRYSTLISALKKEKFKVKKLKPYRYIIATSIGLTPQNKEEIKNLFSPFVKKTSDILGKDDVNNLLGKYSDIERKHFKLWLSSINILETIVKSKVYNYSSFEKEIIEENINLYVENESYHDALKIIGKNKFVIISGIPGIGKTTLGRILIYHYLAQGFEQFINISNNINEGYDTFNDSIKQVYLYDDFLGTNFLEKALDKNEDELILKFVTKLQNSPNKILIFTTREYILNQALSKYEKFKNLSGNLTKCVIDLSKYTKVVRAKILYNHLYFSKIPLEYINTILIKKNYFEIINHPNYSPRIIKAITSKGYWENIPPKNFFAKFIIFLNNPEEIWKHVFENQITPLSKYVLIIMYSSVVPIHKDDLYEAVQKFLSYNSININCDSFDFLKSLKELENTFIKIEIKGNDILADFQNPSIIDFLYNYIKEDKEIIKKIVIGAAFISQMFVKFESKYEKKKAIQLNNELISFREEEMIKKMDNLKFQKGQWWYSDKISIFSKLDYVINNIEINASLPIISYIVNVYENYPIENLKYEEKEPFLEILIKFYKKLKIINVAQILEFYFNEISHFEDVEHLLKLKKIFPLEFKLSRSEVSFFEYDVKNAIRDYERDIDNSDLESFKDEIHDISSALDIDLDQILIDLTLRIEDYKAEKKASKELIEDEHYQNTLNRNEENYYNQLEKDLKLESTSKIKRIEPIKVMSESEDKVIDNMFQSLYDIKKMDD